MIKSVTYATLWVDDQDEAIAFYTEKLGLELREDVTVAELGDFRWVSVGVPGQDVSIALPTVPGAPIFDEETQRLVKEVLARGVAGGVMFGTDDARGTYEELHARGVEFQHEPTEQPYGIDTGIRDPFGNQMRLVQPKE
jgi:catechol 2,3-dioxygenase-like lactoylglutathione lyase family enzyme